MRKRLIAAVTTVAVFAFGGVALAVNDYDVDIASSTPTGKGTAAKPLPQKLRFGYEVTDSEGLRPTVIEQYRIAPEGLITFPQLFPSCTFAQANAPGKASSKCKKAKIGSGLVRNLAGAGTDRNQKLVCNLGLALYNISDAGRNGGMAIRLDGGPPVAPNPVTDVGCSIEVHTAIKAPFFPVRVDGQKTSELRFTVPISLQEPLPGVQNAVIDVTSTVNKRTARTRIKGKRRTVGYYSEVGCKGKRSVRVEFVDTARRKFTANKETKC